MAVYSGLASVTNNNATVTVTSGFTISPSIIFPGAQVLLNGVGYVLLARVNTTQFTLTRPYFGTTATGVRLDINTISENETEIVTLNQRTADLIEDLLEFDPNSQIRNFGALNGSGGNKGVMFGATGQPETFPLTAFARTLLDDANSSAMRTTLEIPALLASFGIGQTGAPTDATNLNTLANAGMYTYSSTATGSPPTGTTGTVIHANRSAANSTQLAITIAGADADVYVRRQASGTWSAWRPLAPIMVSNSNGNAWRFANGLQICTTFTALTADVSTSVGSGARGSASWTFPSPFASGSTTNVISFTGSTARWGASATGISTTGATLNHFASTTSATTSNIFAVAIGLY